MTIGAAAKGLPVVAGFGCRRRRGWGVDARCYSIHLHEYLALYSPTTYIINISKLRHSGNIPRFMLATLATTRIMPRHLKQ